MSRRTRRLLAVLLAAASLPALAVGRYDARDGAECRDQVERNFAALAREMAAHGNWHGITSTWNRWRGPALEECEQMDAIEHTRRMRKANERLDAAIAVLSADGAIRDEARRAIAEEHAASFLAGILVFLAFPHSPYRDAHVALHAQYERYAAAPAASPRDCPAIQRALKSARTEHDLAVDALLRHEPEWRVHDQVRQAAIGEMQFQRFLARRAGCAGK